MADAEGGGPPGAGDRPRGDPAPPGPAVPTTCRALLGTAAILGQSFRPGLLEAISGLSGGQARAPRWRRASARSPGGGGPRGSSPRYRFIHAPGGGRCWWDALGAAGRRRAPPAGGPSPRGSAFLDDPEAAPGAARPPLPPGRGSGTGPSSTRPGPGHPRLPHARLRGRPAANFEARPWRCWTSWRRPETRDRVARLPPAPVHRRRPHGVGGDRGGPRHLRAGGPRWPGPRTPPSCWRGRRSGVGLATTVGDRGPPRDPADRGGARTRSARPTAVLRTRLLARACAWRSTTPRRRSGGEP